MLECFESRKIENYRFRGRRKKVKTGIETMYEEALLLKAEIWENNRRGRMLASLVMREQNIFLYIFIVFDEK